MRVIFALRRPKAGKNRCDLARQLCRSKWLGESQALYKYRSFGVPLLRRTTHTMTSALSSPPSAVTHLEEKDHVDYSPLRSVDRLSLNPSNKETSFGERFANLRFPNYAAT